MRCINWQVSEPVKWEIKRQEDGFVGMFLGAVGDSVLGNILTGKGVIKAGKLCYEMNRTDKNI